MQRLTRRKFLNVLAVPAALGLTLGLGACVGYRGGGPLYADYPAYYYDYYYYPHVGAYYHVFSGDYYYQRDGRWWRTRALPKNIWLDKRYRVPLHITKDRPYEDYDQHYSRYATPGDWQHDEDRSRRDREDNNRSERQYNFDRHIENHRKQGH